MFAENFATENTNILIKYKIFFIFLPPFPKYNKIYILLENKLRK